MEDDDRSLRVKRGHELFTEDHLGDDGNDLVSLNLLLLLTFCFESVEANKKRKKKKEQADVKVGGEVLNAKRVVALVVGKDKGAEGLFLELLGEHGADLVGVGKGVPEGEGGDDVRGLLPVAEVHGAGGGDKVLARRLGGAAVVVRLVAVVLEEALEGL